MFHISVRLHIMQPPSDRHANSASDRSRHLTQRSRPSLVLLSSSSRPSLVEKTMTTGRLTNLHRSSGPRLQSDVAQLKALLAIREPGIKISCRIPRCGALDCHVCTTPQRGYPIAHTALPKDLDRRCGKLRLPLW
jgi:hypothetical protein